MLPRTLDVVKDTHSAAKDAGRCRRRSALDRASDRTLDAAKNAQDAAEDTGHDVGTCRQCLRQCWTLQSSRTLNAAEDAGRCKERGILDTTLNGTLDRTLDVAGNAGP